MYRSVVVHELSDNFANISVKTFEREDIQPDEVRIKVKSASVNFPDLLMTAGLYQYKPEVPFVLGMESSGIVIEKGIGVENFEVNDEVIISSFTGSFSEELCVDKIKVRNSDKIEYIDNNYIINIPLLKVLKLFKKKDLISEIYKNINNLDKIKLRINDTWDDFKLI